MPSEAITILHLSDPQFGKNHVFGKRALPLSDGKHDTLLSRTCDDLDLLGKEWGLRPDIVVLTGDLAEWGLEEEFRHCFDFLAGIGAHLGITPEQRNRIAVIPGNHDIHRDLAAAEHLEWRAKGKKGEPFGFRRFEFFAKAFKAFYKKVPAQTIGLNSSVSVSLKPDFGRKEMHSLFIVPELKVVLAGLNSVLAECHYETAEAKTHLGDSTVYGHHGYCGEDQYRHFAKLLATFVSEEWFRIGLVHHNVVRGATRDDENLTDAEVLKRYLGETLNLLLHGHTHVADRALLPLGQPILSTGSTALSSAQRPNETPNQYQVIQVTSAGVHAWLRAFDHHGRRWIPDSRVGGERSPGQLTISYPFTCVSASLETLASSKSEPAEAHPDLEKPSPAKRGLLSELLDERRERFEPLVMAAKRIAELRWQGCHMDLHETWPLYLNVVTNEAFGFRSFAVGLLLSAHKVSAQIDQFDFLTENSSWERWLVTSPAMQAQEASAVHPAEWDALKAKCSEKGIRLLSWRDYERMSDLRIAVENQKTELLTSKDYPQALYVPQRMEFFTTLAPVDPIILQNLKKYWKMPSQS